MSYYIDYKSISLEKFFEKVRDVSMLPSQKALTEKPEDKLNRIKSFGISNAQELRTALKNKSKITEFSQKTGIDEDYLVLLNRELARYQPKALLLKEFPGLGDDIVGKLEQCTIKNTLQLYDRVTTPEARMELAGQTGISHDKVLELSRLADVSRIMWTTPTFARLLIEAGFESVSKIAGSDSNELCEKLLSVNTLTGIYKGRIGQKDMALFIRYTQDVPQTMIW